MRRAATILLAAVASVIALAPGADAHALISSSDPAAGAQLESAPAAVTIVFTETPEPSLSSIRVLDASGTSFERGRAVRVPGDQKALRIALKPLERGVYTVSWRALSRVDGHFTAGAFAFGVGVPVDPNATPPPGVTVTPDSPSPSAIEVAGRWLFFVGLLGLIGGTWVSASTFTPGVRLVPRPAAWGWFLGIAGLVLIAEAQRRAADTGIGDLLATSLGRALIGRAIGLVAAGAALIGAARAAAPTTRKLLLWAAAVAGASAAYAHVSAGHAAASSPEWAEVLAQWVHVVAVSVWIGGLAALLGRLRGTPDDTTAAAVRRFSSVAAFALAVVLGTGVVRAFAELTRWSALWESGYGVVVLVKVGLILTLAALGAVNRYRNVPRAHITVDELQRVSRTEVGIGAGALVAAALLASLAPPPEPARAAEPAGIVASAADFATTVRVRLSAAPGTAGSNRFVVRVTDYDTGEPIRASRISLRFRYVDDTSVGESTLELRRDGDAYTATGLPLSIAGRYRVTVLIQRGGDSQEIALEIATRCVTTAVPGPPTIYTVDLGAGATVQGYVRPGDAGPNEVHVTFFAASGNEQPVDRGLTLRGSSGSRTLDLTSRKLSAGHFVADGDLEEGLWRFDFSATVSGASLRGCFTETIR